MSEESPQRSAVAAAYDGLTEATNNFTKAVGKLRRQQRWVLVGIAALVLLLAGVGFTGYQLYDCTVERGGCYKKGQKRTGEAIGNLIVADVLSDARVGACVTEAKGDEALFRRCIRVAFPVEARKLYPPGSP